jgi:hypothetical protein
MHDLPRRGVFQKVWSFLKGLAIVILLAPVPAFALDVSNLNWSFDAGNSTSPFQQIQQTTDTSTHNIITFFLRPSTNYGGTESITLTQTGTVTFPFFDNTNGTTLNATWSGLNGLQDTGSGTVEISIVTTLDGSPNTMFSQAATSQPQDGAITGVNVSGYFPNQVSITVRFKFINFSQSSTATSFTLDFHN